MTLDSAMAWAEHFRVEPDGAVVVGMSRDHQGYLDCTSKALVVTADEVMRLRKLMTVEFTSGVVAVKLTQIENDYLLGVLRDVENEETDEAGPLNTAIRLKIRAAALR